MLSCARPFISLYTTGCAFTHVITFVRDLYDFLTEQINPFNVNALLISIALYSVVLVSSAIGTFIPPPILHLPRGSGNGSPLTVLKL